MAGPLLSCLDVLFEHQRDGVPFDAAVQALVEMLSAHANDRTTKSTAMTIEPGPARGFVD